MVWLPRHLPFLFIPEQRLAHIPYGEILRNAHYLGLLLLEQVGSPMGTTTSLRVFLAVTCLSLPGFSHRDAREVNQVLFGFLQEMPQTGVLVALNPLGLATNERSQHSVPLGKLTKGFIPAILKRIRLPEYSKCTSPSDAVELQVYEALAPAPVKLANH